MDNTKNAAAGGHGRGKRLTAALSFAIELNGGRLAKAHGDPSSAQSTAEDLRSYINDLHLRSQRHDPVSAGRQQYDEQGTTLWNLCTRLGREASSDSMPALSKQVVLYGRVFAVLLLDMAQWSPQCTRANAARLLKLALKAARNCIDGSELDLARTVLERATDYNTRLEEVYESGEEELESQDLNVEYYALRAGLAWRGDHLELADHMYKKVDANHKSLRPESAERLAELLFEIGKDLSVKTDYESASRWLERSYDIISAQDLERLPRDALELRLAIVQALVTSLLRTQKQDAFERAEQLVNYIETESGHSLAVCLLKLELLENGPAEVFDAESFATVLRRMVQMFNHSDSTFKLLVHYAQKLHDKAPSLACQITDDFIRLVVKSEHSGWLSRLVILRIWMTTSQRDTPEALGLVQHVLDQIRSPLENEPTMACLALVSNKVDASYSQNEFDSVERWCRLALHRVFEHSGPQNKAMLERKILLCAMTANNLDSAVSVFHSMHESTQKDPKTMYLMYKVSIRKGDRELARQCLEAVSTAPDSKDYLYACAVDSSNASDKRCAVDAMKVLVDKYEFAVPSRVHLPALLRCLIRLLNSMLGEEGEVEWIVQDLCDIFATSVSVVRRQPNDAESSRLFTVDELVWLSTNAYNLGLKYSGNWPPRHTVQILKSCVDVIAMFPEDIATPVADDLALRAMFSHFLIASTLVTLARSEDKIEVQLQDYLVMRLHVAQFDEALQGRLAGLEDESRIDMLEKLATLLAFDFEAVLALKKWEELGEVIRKAEICESSVAYKAMGDCLLRSPASGNVLYGTMRTIINKIFELEDFDTHKIAKYTRCLYMATLPLNDDLVLDLVTNCCRQVYEVVTAGAPWPMEELEWLATQAFNHAVDLYSTNQDDRSQKWASQALNLAHYAPDEGRLEKLLQDHYKKLNFCLGDSEAGQES